MPVKLQNCVWSVIYELVNLLLFVFILFPLSFFSSFFVADGS